MINEAKVYEVALQSVGGFENYICDNGLEGTDEANITRERMMEYAYIDVVDECPREVRFLGKKAIEDICYKAADKFEYRTW